MDTMNIEKIEKVEVDNILKLVRYLVKRSDPNFNFERWLERLSININDYNIITNTKEA